MFNQERFLKRLGDGDHRPGEARQGGRASFSVRLFYSGGKPQIG
jgi:hypothetical protein